MRNTYHDVMSLVGTLLQGQQRNGAEKIGLLADNARKLASDMHDLPHVTAYVELGADRLDDFADYVNDTPLEEMISDGAEFAKRNPIPTIGIAAIAGFCATRMISMPGVSRRASPRRRAHVNGSAVARTNGSRKSASA
jgi:hypothetical protein